MTPSAPRALALVQQLYGSAAWRVVWPFAELERQGYPFARWGWNDDPVTSAKIADADLVILHRSAWKPGDEAKALAWRDLLHAGGKALVLDCDDDLYSPALTDLQLQPDLKLGKSVEQLEQERAANIFALRLVDGVTCSTPYLAEVCRGLTDRPVVVVPNAIDLPRFRAALVGYQRSTQPITIGWAGGSRPDRDARDLAVAWGRIARRFGGVRFVVAGHPLGALVNSVPADRLTILPNLPLDLYPRNYAEIDIGCCTLAEVEFNRSKCVDSSMLVTTNKGLIPAGQITTGMRVWRNGWKAVQAVSRSDPRPGIQITTRRGYRLRLTPEHRMMVAGVWKRAGDIIVGDTMCMEPEQILPSKFIRVPWPADSRMSRAAVHISPEGRRATFDPKAFLNASDGPQLDITPRWGRFLGAFAGDGSCGQATVVQISCDGQDQDWIDMLMEDFRAFGLNPSTETITTFGGVILRRRGIQVASAHLVRVLESLGVARQRASGRPIRVPCVPDVIWRSPKPVIAEFIAAYFEADGHCTSSGVAAVSKDEQLLRDIQRLLILFGITSLIRSRTHYAQNGFSGLYWHLELRRAEADVFASEIGFRSQRKRTKLASIMARPHSNAYRPIVWECEVVDAAPCDVTPVDIQVEGETFILAGFVSHNSTIKAMEFAAAGAAVVASPTVYAGLIQQWVNGLVARDASEWEYALTTLIERPDYRQHFATVLHIDVERNHTLQANAHRWPAAWSEILADFDARRDREVVAFA